MVANAKKDAVSTQGGYGKLLHIIEKAEAQLKDEGRKRKTEKSCPLHAPLRDITALPASIRAK